MCDSQALKEESGFHLQHPIGKYVDELCQESSGGEKDRDVTWLDCDVIDSTGLDTNVNELRHSAYNVNSILLRDIEEIIVTRKRASERTTLLHKKGTNVFEFIQAPSFIKM